VKGNLRPDPDKEGIYFFILIKKVYISKQCRCLKLLSLIRIEVVQHVTMVRYWATFVLLALITVWAGGMCPDRCRCPSIYVANCVSADLRKVPSDGYVCETFCE
jgi:hypothetical protein